MNLLIKKGINNYLITDLRTLVVFRVCLSVALILDLLINRAPSMVELYSNEGVLTTEAVSKFSSAHKFSALYYIKSVFGVKLFFSVYFLLCLSLLMGFKTRFVAPVLYVFFFSILERVFPFITGADTVLNLMLFWSMFLPLSGQQNMGSKKEESNYIHRSVAVFALTLQIALIYFFNFLFKNGETWSDGSAVGYALSIYAHQSFMTNLLVDLPVFWPIFTFIVKWGWLFVSFLILSPVKQQKAKFYACIFIFIFHYGLIPFLNVGTFYISVLPVLAFLLPYKYVEKFLKYF
jgi:hypothetical protein